MTEPLRALIIEDSGVDFLLITRQLRQAGFELVAERIETEEALEHALDSATWDIVLCDVQLPRLSAVFALNALARRELDIPFIVVSGTIGEEAAVILMKSGAHDFFIKGRLTRLPIAITRELREAKHRRERRAAEKALHARTRQQAAVSEFGLKALTLNKPQLLFEDATSQVTSVLEVDFARVLEVQPDEMTFMQRAAAGTPGGTNRSIVANAAQQPLAAHAIATNEPVIVHDFAVERRFTAPPDVATLGVVSAISVVIQKQEKPFGVLSVFSTMARVFSEDDINFVQSVANILSYAIRNAELLQAEVRAREAAERADQLKSRFLALISHELRTPLTSIKGFLSTILAEDIEWDAKAQREFIQIANEETDNLAWLIDQLIDLAQLNAGTFAIARRVYGVRPLVEQALAGLEPVGEADRVRIEIPENLPSIHADPRRIQQVLLHLLSNAVKYSPSDSPIRVAAQVDGGAVRVDVADQGQGIPADIRRIVFDAFHKIEVGERLNMRGAGMGLAISRGIIEAHDGKIWLHEQQEPGTTISFTLPLASAS